MYKEGFPERIRKARIEAGYTQKQVAEKLNIPQSNISKYESGQLEPNLEYLASLAEFYNVSINWLLSVTLEPVVKEPPKITNNQNIKQIKINM